MTLGEFSIKNPVFLNILMFALLILGYLSLSRMPREQFSEVPFYWINITVPFPGIGAEDVEQLITIPIENEMFGLDELDEIQSESKDGISLVSVRFNSDINQNKFDKLFQNVQTNFSRVDLPNGVLKESIDSFSSNDFSPVIEVVISSTLNYEKLIEASNKITDEIEKIPQVSKVDKIGSRTKIILIDIDQNKLESKNLTLNMIVDSLRSKNINIPGGTISTNTRDYLIRTVGEIDDISQFEEIVIRKGIKIRDIGSVSQSFKEGNIARFNSKNSITLRVAKVPKGNSIEIVNSVKKVLKHWDNTLTKKIEINTLNDSTIQIKSSLDTLIKNAILGFICLVLILFVFVGLRNSLITSLGIPLTFAITFILLELSGETFNSNTLFGLVLVLGLIVDHSIVIIENSYRLEQNGLPKREASINGVNQVFLPVIAASGTTIAAFLPLMILPGTIGKFLRVIPLTVSIAILASTLEALIFLPNHYYDWPSSKKKRLKRDFFNNLKKKYKNLICYFYKKKKLTVTMFLLTMTIILSLSLLLEQDLFSAEDYTLFYIDIEMPDGTTLYRTDSIVKKYEEIIMPLIKYEEIVSISSTVGFLSSQGGNTNRGNVAQIVVDLLDDSRKRRSITEIMEEIKNKTNIIPGPDRVFFRKAVNGPPQDPPISFRLYGDNLKGLKESSMAISKYLAQKSELINIENDIAGGSTELKIIINQERALTYQLSILTIGQHIRAVIDGITATSYVKNNESIDVLLKLNDKNKIDISRLYQIVIPTPDGRQIPFSAVAKIVESKSVGKIKRVDGKRVVTISSDAIENKNIPNINREIEELFKGTISTKYPDQTIVTGGEFAEFNNLIFQIFRIFLLGIFLIYLILGTQFKSYIQPFLILFSVPMSFAGVILFLLVSNTPFSTTVLYAGVALAGIAVNDSIVLISFINELRSEGKKTEEAVIEAATTRLRPILLTSLTTIAGLLPTALGLGGRSVVWQPMANTIIFGLLFSTLTALILIPTLYGLIFERAKHKHL